MNSHTASPPASMKLCDALYRNLSLKINNLQREQASRWCGYYQQGKKRFAYVSHRKRSNGLEIWFLGTPKSTHEFRSLKIRHRRPSSGGFAKDFEARFELSEEGQLHDAVNLLYYVSYRASDPNQLIDSEDSLSVHERPSPNISVVEEETFLEGERRASSSASRNPRLRIAAKKQWGTQCYCCGFDFGQFYGATADGFAVVHHLEPFSGGNVNLRESSTDDVRVVCANCHHVLHLKVPPLNVDELRATIESKWERWSQKGFMRRHEVD